MDWIKFKDKTPDTQTQLVVYRTIQSRYLVAYYANKHWVTQDNWFHKCEPLDMWIEIGVV